MPKNKPNLADFNPDLAKQWHPTKNLPLTPLDVTPGGKKKVWWKCDKCSESYEATVQSRKRGAGCPYCSGKKVSAKNNLQQRRPDIARFWHPSRNGSVRPSDVTYGSGVRYWWKCPVGDDHEWIASVNTMTGTQSRGCPFCSKTCKRASKDNNLEVKFPELIAEWHFERNTGKGPSEFTTRSTKKVWWKCNKGHAWKARIADRTRPRNPTGCKKCSRLEASDEYNLGVMHPSIAAEWNYEKNQGLKPGEFTPGSEKSVWWKCEKGHEWTARIADRVRAPSCPYCSRRRASEEYNLAILHPDIAKEWHPRKNGKKNPRDVTPGSRSKFWWLCRWGHEWKAEVNNRVGRKSGCPQCRSRTSERELRMYCELKTIFPDAKRIPLLHGWQCDIYIPQSKMAIEVDGGYHHKSPEKHETDRQKNRTLKQHGIRVIRIRDYGLGKISEIDIVCKKGEGDLPIIKRFLQRIKAEGLVSEKDQEKIRAYLTRDTFAGDHDFRRVRSYLPGPEPENSLAILYSELADEWDYEANHPLTPDMFTSGSGKAIAWKCSKNPDHKWLASIANRALSKTGCPFCTNKKVAHDNNLASKHPEIAAEWHPTKNAELTPEDVLPGADKKIWWICNTCAWEWQAYIYHRAKPTGGGCPRCKGKILNKKLNLSTRFPNIAAEWHPTKNRDESPLESFPMSSKKRWWLCKVCGKEWEARISDRTSHGSGCPECAEHRKKAPRMIPIEKSLAHLFPELCQEWSPAGNGSLNPKMLTPGSGRKVVWVCGQCSHTWEATVSNRTGGQGCPYCAGRRVSSETSLAVIFPNVAKEWHPTQNGSSMPSDFTAFSGRKVWWMCCQCGHEWPAKIGDRARGTGCPKCANILRSEQLRNRKRKTENT